MDICDKVKITDLVISDKIEDKRDYWFHSNKKFNYIDAIDMRTFTTYRSTFRWDKFLKRLHFKGGKSDLDRLNLNDLIGLEQLEIDQDDSTYNNVKFHIVLPNLKILVVDEHSYELNLTTPKLEMLKCFDLNEIVLDDRNTINHLEVFLLDEAALTLKNLQYLKAELVSFSNQAILSAYPKLTTIVFSEFDYDSIVEGDWKIASINRLRHFFELKRNRSELKIYFQSVEFVTIDKIEEYKSAQSTLAFQISNYNLLCDNILYDSSVDYNELMRLVNGFLPDDFYKKYFNISSVEVSGEVESLEHLEHFLKSLDYLQELHLENIFLDQTFCDGLNAISQLTNLRIKGASSTSIFNFHFLLNFKFLESFFTDRDFPDLLNLTVTLFRELKYFESMDFYFYKEFIAISNFGNGYSFRRYKDLSNGHRQILFKKERMDFDHLIRLIEAYKNFRSNSRIEFDLSFAFDG